MTKKKYYILYKVKKDTNCNITDIEYLKEYTTLTDIVKDQHIHFNTLKDIINNDFDTDIKTFKDLTIILDTDI